MGLGAPQGPAAQSPQGELREQLVHVFHHGTQPPRGLAGELMEQFEVPAHHIAVAEPMGGQGHVGHHQGDHGARGVGGELHQGADDIGDDVLPQLLGDTGHLLDVGEDQVLPLVQGAHGLHAREVVVESLGGHDPGRLVIAGLERRVVLVSGFGVDAGDVFGEIDGHSFTLKATLDYSALVGGPGVLCSMLEGSLIPCGAGGGVLTQPCMFCF